MIDRRTLIIAGTAAATSLVVGTQSAVAETIASSVDPESFLDHPLMQNVIRHMEHTNKVIGAQMSDKMLLAVNLSLIAKYGHELFPDPSLYMTAPTMIAKDGTPVEAKMRKYDVRWTFQPASEVLPQAENVTEEEILSDLMEKIHDELATAIKASPNTKFYPYIPVVASGVIIDPATFEPTVCFMTRYGTA